MSYTNPHTSYFFQQFPSEKKFSLTVKTYSVTSRNCFLTSWINLLQLGPFVLTGYTMVI